MGAYLLHLGALVTCAHEGIATPVSADPAVLVSGMPVALMPIPWMIAGCTFPPPPVANGPCVTAEFVTAAVRVTANGMPVLLANSESICVLSGTPLEIDTTQMRVKGT